MCWTQQKSLLRLYDKWASPVSWDPSIVVPGTGNFPSYHACRAARQMNQARNRTAANTLLMHTASDLYIKMAAPGWSGSCNTGIKVTSPELASPTNRASPGRVIRPLLWVVLSRSLHVKALELATFAFFRFVSERNRLFIWLTQAF